MDFDMDGKCQNGRKSTNAAFKDSLMVPYYRASVNHEFQLHSTVALPTAY